MKIEIVLASAEVFPNKYRFTIYNSSAPDCITTYMTILEIEQLVDDLEEWLNNN